jgi:peptide/nickel transport system substrate-binding protein
MNNTRNSRFTRRQFIAWGGGAGAAAVLTACGSNSSNVANQTKSSGPPAKASGTLNIAIPADPLSLDPVKYNEDSSLVIYTAVMEPLYEFDEHQNLKPVLAAGLPTMNASATSFTVPLRQDVTFHNGKRFGSDDVKFTVEQVLNPANASNNASFLQAAALKSVETPDQFTAVFNTGIPARYFFQTSTEMMIVPSNVPYNASTYATSLIGTGPFKFVSWQHGIKIVLTRNDHYWASGLPHLQGVEYQIIPTTAAQLAGAVNGSIQMVPGLSPAYASVARSRGVALYAPTTELGIDWLWPNWGSSSPMSDVNLRLAVAYAINRNRITNVVYKGYGHPEDTIPARGSIGYDPSIGGAINPNGDPAAARKYLKAAGGAPSQPLRLVAATDYQQGATEAQLIQQDLADVGIQVSIVNEAITSALADLVSGKYDLWFVSEVVTPPPTQPKLLDGVGSLLNYNKVDDAQLSALANQAVNDVSVVPQIQKRALQVMPQIPIVTYPPLFAMGKDVSGFTATGGGSVLSGLGSTWLT